MTDKVIIVTGASRGKYEVIVNALKNMLILPGIGLAVSRYLLGEKCKLVLVSRSKEPLNKLRDEYPQQVQVIAGDFADLDLSQRVVDHTISTWARIDGLVINHGVLDPVKRIGDVTAEEWRKSFDVNVFSAISMVIPNQIRHCNG